MTKIIAMVLAIAGFAIYLATGAQAASLCQYAGSATATSENSLGSLALYAVGTPSAPTTGVCTDWSGYGYSWTPTSWNVKANLTLNYDTPIYVSNFTIFGDYDMCWDRAWLKNSATGSVIQAFSGPDTTCALTIQSSANFLADTVILETCGWAWSSTDAVSMCGLNAPSATNVSICGNSIIETGEQCDKGTQNGIVCTAPYGGSCTYCTSTCTNATITGAFCGDGIINGAETCDDGNKVNGDGCSSTCQKETNTTKCGNGILETGEQCDNGSSNTNTPCTASYSSTCSYCDLSCISHAIKGPYCGDSVINGAEQCDDGNIVAGDGCSPACQIEGNTINTNGCQYASSASATSEYSPGSIAAYAANAPNAPTTGICTDWSGYGYSWTPTSWNVKANLTLNYNSPLYVDNFTILGDYDICWDRAWLSNSANGKKLQVLNGPSNSCTLTINSTAGFLADSIVLETCGWAWSSTDAVKMCGRTTQVPLPPPSGANVSICTWKNCEKGAVSVSVDDYYSSCADELERNGYRGTYFLTNTNTYSAAQWNSFNALFLKGHELGTHTEGHLCSGVSATAFISDMNSNINDIIAHTSATAKDLISHAYPCGYVSSTMKTALQSNWNFLSARGYYFNQMENSTPTDYFNLKSFNSVGYPGGVWDPPNYFTLLDSAEQQGTWVNLVFHNECSDSGVIDTIPARNLWVDTIGNVVRYTKLRDNAKITSVQITGSQITFSVSSTLTDAIYRQSLTMKIAAAKQPLSVLVNNQPVAFSWNAGIVIFDLPFPANGAVIINL